MRDISPPALELAQCVAALLLLGLALPALALALRESWHRWREASKAERWTVAAATVVAAVLRWAVAPLWIATVFLGYRHTQHAIDLTPISHYGVGASSLYHLLFAVFPADHYTLMGANAVMGVVLVPLVASYAATLLDDRRAGAVAAVLVAVVPLFVRNDTSDANNVPCLLWLLAGLVLWQRYLADGRRLEGLAALALAAMAAVSRPEMPIVAAALFVLTAWAARRLSRPVADPWLVVGAVVCIGLVVPHVMHVQNAVQWLRATHALPGYGWETFARLPGYFVQRNLLFEPALFPIAVTMLAIAAPFVTGEAGRRPDLALVAAVVLLVLLYVVDLDPANIARVHTPAALFATVLASATVARASRRLDARWALPAAAVLVALAAVPNALALWQPTNEQAEEDFLQEVLPLLPEEPFVLVTVQGFDLRRDDPTKSGTHTAFPSYLVRPPVRSGEVVSIESWLRDPRWDRPAYFYAGVRCYSAFRRPEEPKPEGDNLQPACRRMRERFELVPLKEREIPNRGDVWIRYYGDADALPLGLYRIEPSEGEEPLAGGAG